MTSREEAQFKTATQVKKYLDDSTDKWNTVPALLRYKNTLDESLQAIHEKSKEVPQNSKPVTQQKNEVKAVAALKAAILAGAVSAYAAEHGNLQLQQAADLTKSALEKMSDRSFRAPIDHLIAAARAELEALADQGVTDEQLTELETTLDDFSELIGDPRRIQISAALKSRAVSDLINEIVSLLNDQLDKSMLRYKLIDPSFYEGYERARVIVG